MVYKRKVAPKVLKYVKQFPIVTIVGPRQSGKTTLVKMLFPKKAYVSLEDIDNRNFAQNDPRGFLAEYNEGAIIDEIQRVPDLLSYLQTFVDEKNKEGLFIITGSQQFEMLNKVSQSLAGRTAIVRLLPFEYSEIYKPSSKESIEDVLYTGFYPRIFDKKISPTDMMSFYTNTYLERDVRLLINVQDLSKFENFIRICAGRTGQIVNLSSIANECGIKHNTVKSWLSILQASYIIKLLKPFHRNINKRLVKSPKLYFLDSALACFLLGITEKEQIKYHPLKGALFESLIVSEILKQQFNNGKTDNLYFYRDAKGNEIDVVIDNATSLELIEVKSSMTIQDDFLKPFASFDPAKNIKQNLSIIYGGNKEYKYKDVQIKNWRKFSV